MDNVYDHCEDRNSPVHVLVVEDAPEFRRYLEWTLTKLGMKVDVAADGSEAMNMVLHACETAHPHDLIVSDLDMPAMNGFELIARLRDLGVNTPVIALTGTDEGQCRTQCLDAGFDEIACKPVSAVELQRVWQRISLRR
jgi:CheY-like chemotaxis protein